MSQDSLVVAISSFTSLTSHEIAHRPTYFMTPNLEMVYCSWFFNPEVLETHYEVTIHVGIKGEKGVQNQTILISV
jgi:hypothetical protein